MSAEIKNAIASEKGVSTQELLHEKNNTVDHETLIDLLHKKIDLVTEGLNRYLRKQLKEQVSVENSAIISDYALIQKTDILCYPNYYFRKLLRMNSTSLCDFAIVPIFTQSLIS